MFQPAVTDHHQLRYNKTTSLFIQITRYKMMSIILTLKNFKDVNTKFRNQIKITYLDEIQTASLKVNLKDLVKKGLQKKTLNDISTILTKIAGLKKIDL